MNVRVLFAIALIITLILSSGSRAQTATNGDNPRKAFVEEKVTVDTGTGFLYGTLFLPQKQKAPWPVALIIAGSGPTDRDGNSTLLPGPNNSLRMLAEGLATAGIASLRYDKRGIGESKGGLGNEADFRFATAIEDAAAWAKKLRVDKRFSTLTIVGHSEGSLIGMVAATDAAADAYISIAGVGRTAGSIILEQVRPQFTAELMKQTEEIVGSLNAGRPYSPVPAELMILFRPSIQPYMISWFKYDPSQEIGKLNVPVLILQGTTDIQVHVQDAKLLSKGAPNAKLVVIDGMNHVLKRVSSDPAEQQRSYSDPSLPVVPELINEISGFINNLKKGPASAK